MADSLVYPNPQQLTTVRRVAEALTATYGAPPREPLPLGNKPDPLDELIYIILTVMTEFGVDDVYAAIRREYPTWERLRRGRRTKLVRLLQPIGLSEQRADRIRAILARIYADRGECSLDFIGEMSNEEAEAYLTSLPGVGLKVARCVLMYSLGRDVLPVDAHVLRTARRLGVLSADTSWSRAHEAIHLAVPAEYRYQMHVNLVQLGRDVCDARHPRCEACCLHGNLCTGSSPAAGG